MTDISGRNYQRKDFIFLPKYSQWTHSFSILSLSDLVSEPAGQAEALPERNPSAAGSDGRGRRRGRRSSEGRAGPGGGEGGGAMPMISDLWTFILHFLPNIMQKNNCGKNKADK